ncbi:glycogen debranching enzyme [Silvibacterium bohemicum]|uniref:Glycogen debranching enzyme n=1 Tax=Silvibacterium bohemicum TaxID=1577686 RepID=A0A841JVL1_9BACT|nr:glycogen debranching protein [Silvibacterium bohemicum]MBB6145423.1 glycogen debranching enzyme [Silvibacterium bohemicum]
MKTSVLLLMFCSALCGALPLDGQSSPALNTLPEFPHSSSTGEMALSREAVPSKPFSVIGPRGALLGEQNGRYEAWIFPWKIFSGMRITAAMEGYPVPIDVNDHAAEIDVQPDHTTITYSHANFTVRQIMLAPKQSPDGAGVQVFYQIEAIRPVTLTFSFDPVMQKMWPAASGGNPSPEWVATQGGSGFYILHEDLPGDAAALAMPSAEAGILAPYQERARTWPLQFVLHFDPKKDQDRLFPLLMTVADSQQSSTKEGLARSLEALDSSSQATYTANRDYYRNFVQQHTNLDSPDADLNAAFSWAEVAIDQLRVQTIDHKEEALTAGFVGSGDAARPGFGWFFGRDALWSLYAVNSYGDYATTREEIEFLLHRQRADGKIMHEWSQTADLVDWKSLPYEYAAADATELLPMAMNDYLKISGDAAFIASHWDALAKAWNFETSHDSADGIYNNGQGTGWVESWIPSMPQQEIYLAVLDEEASQAFAHLAQSAGHGHLAAQAKERAATIRATIEKEYFLPSSNFYAFSRNADGTTDDTATIFPSVAWWDGDSSLNHPDEMLNRWASAEFSTDWGTRILSDRTNFYDPISYHQGTVWPLFTGWVSVAEYRAGRSLSGYAHLMQNANLTWAQDLGATTELLSGQFYQALGRSTAHQLWSSAMVISPVLRGMFGLEWDAAEHSLNITPHLPANWNHAALRRLPVGDKTVDLVFTRRGQELVVEASGAGAAGLHLASHAEGARAEGGLLRIPLPAVEVAIAQQLPPFGDETKQMKVLDEKTAPHRLVLTLAAQGSSEQKLLLKENAPGLKMQTSDAALGAVNDGLRELVVEFPAGVGYVTKTVTISW